MTDSRLLGWIRALFRPSAKRSVFTLLVIGLVVGVVGILAFDYTMYATSTDEFCVSCHEQKDNSLAMFK